MGGNLPQTGFQHSEKEKNSCKIKFWVQLVSGNGISHSQWSSKLFENLTLIISGFPSQKIQYIISCYELKGIKFQPQQLHRTELHNHVVNNNSIASTGIFAIMCQIECV